MAAMIRHVAAVLVAVFLPIQGYAAACAQICAASGKAHASMADESAHEADSRCHQAPAETPAHPGEGDAPNPGVAKCCQAHVFAIDHAIATPSLHEPHPVQAPYVARWSNFIADEPSPPPIAAFTHA
jgi:hypothetical protein